VGVKVRDADYAFACTNGGRSYFRYVNSGLYTGACPRTAAAATWRYGRLLGSLLRFLVAAPLELRRGGVPDALTLAEYLSSRGYPAAFFADLLGPMLSVVLTCSYASVSQYVTVPLLLLLPLLPLLLLLRPCAAAVAVTTAVLLLLHCYCSYCY